MLLPAGLSDWTFQAALAGYLTALVCDGIEFAARPGQARELAVGVAPRSALLDG